MADLNTYFFVCKGVVPSKKNSRNQFYNKGLGRTINIPDQKYLAWEKRQRVLCRTMYGFDRNPIEKCSKIQLDFFYPDYRRRDLTNGAESINDMLVSAKIIKDDCWKVTGSVILNPHLDKHDPRCEITIFESERQGELYE